MKVSCACFIQYDKTEDLAALDFASLPSPVFHMGAGSNLLFTGDFGGTVLHSGIRFIKYFDMGLPEVLVSVGSGVVFDDFVAETCGYGLWGAENLSLIPGEVGAAAVQNIGAYGVEVKDIIVGVVCFDTVEKKKRTFKLEECQYGYRSSFFKQPENKGRYIVTSVLFKLTRDYSPRLSYSGVTSALPPTGPYTPMQVREAVIGIRRSKLPDPKEMGSAGSFFKNPVVTNDKFVEIERIAKEINGAEYAVPHFCLEDGSVKVPAAWLISQCGFKGMQAGGAAVYVNQPLVIVNYSGDATPEDVMELEGRIVAGVYEKFGVELNPEVEHI